MRAQHQSESRGPHGKAHQRGHSSITDKQLIALIQSLGPDVAGKSGIRHQVRPIGPSAGSPFATGDGCVTNINWGRDARLLALDILLRGPP
jgi:hypothetical protein